VRFSRIRLADINNRRTAAVAEREHPYVLAAIFTLLAAKVDAAPAVRSRLSHCPLYDGRAAIAVPPNVTVPDQVLDEDLVWLKHDKLSKVHDEPALLGEQAAWHRAVLERSETGATIVHKQRPLRALGIHLRRAVQGPNVSPEHHPRHETVPDAAGVQFFFLEQLAVQVTALVVPPVDLRVLINLFCLVTAELSSVKR
jgi:hypothetical protein